MSDSNAFLIVGLGNPGTKYDWTRHNIGMLMLRSWAEDIGLNWKEKFKANYSTTSIAGQRLVLLMPKTYMNLSGESVRPCADFFNISSQRILVIHDEIDFEFGRVAFKSGGGHGGHNGLKSIEQHLGTRDFLRLRMGVGRPIHGDVSNWVLSRFSENEISEVADIVDWSIQAVQCMLGEGLTKASQRYNKSLLAQE